MSRITLIATFDGIYPRMIVNKLIDRGIRPNILLGSPVAQKCFTYASLKRIVSRHGWLEAFYRFKDRRSEKTANIAEIPSVLECDCPIDYYDFLNSGVFLNKLLKTSPDVILLGGCGILGGWGASIAKLGTVNAHPALLPGIRGVDVVEWSIIENKPFGVTAHLVSEKVDSGEILITTKINPKKDEELVGFKSRLITFQSQVIVDAACELIEGKANPIKHNIDESIFRYATTKAVRKEASKLYAEKYLNVDCKVKLNT